MLFGMNAASTLKTNLDGFTYAAHNEYIDLLLNIGVLGAIIYLGAILLRSYNMFIGVRRDGDAYCGCIFMMKVIWLCYAFTLTMFGDFRFMLLFLI
jgi:O-antigen ligase